MPRAKPSRPTKKMRQAALEALHTVVRDGAVAPYVRAKAAASLLGADREAPDSHAPLLDPDAPRTLIFLPDNGRGRGPVKLGPQEDSGIVIFDSGTPEGLADYARWRAEAEAAGHKIIAPQ